MPVYSFSQSHDPAPYCLDKVGNHSMGCVITKVQISNLLNIIPSYVPQGNANQQWWGYDYYDTISPAVVHIDSSYTLLLSFDYSTMWNNPTPHQPRYYAVWIDFDHNNHFDSSEVVLSNVSNGTLISDTCSQSIQVHIPHMAHIGQTRMRVSRHDQNMNFYANNLLQPCDGGYANSTGSIQDYNIVITDTLPTIDTPTGIKEPPSKELYAYPNPSRGIFRIGDQIIDLSPLPSGIYYRKVKNNWYKLMKN